MANSSIVGVLRVLLQADIAQFDAAMKRSADSARVWSRDLQNIGRQATQVGTALTKTLTLPLVALAGGSVKAAMDFESSFANVRKTVDASKPALDAFAKQIRQLSTEIPVTTNELNKIAALGGQMGVPIEQLEHFTKNVAALGVAVDGLSTEDAAAGLAQIGNATGTGTKNVAEMASALAHLGNKSNATEADILEFTKRLVGAGHTVGMTVPEIMALGTAMADVGINAEAGGTAMSTVISKMSKAVSEGGSALEEFARVANVSAEEFAETWQRKPIEAMNLFIKGLGSMRERGVDLNLTMGELGTEGVRVQDTLKRLAGASTGLADSLTIANEGFSTGNKHLIEAEEKYKTTANQLKTLWNQITNVGVTLGNAMLPAIRSLVEIGKSLIPVLDVIARAFAALPGGIQLGIIGVAGLVAAIGPLLFIAGQLITSLGTVIATFAKGGIAARGLASAHDLLAASNVRLAASMKLLIGGAGVAAVGAAIVGVEMIERALDEKLKKIGADIEQSTAAIQRKELELASARALGNEVLEARIARDLRALQAGRDQTLQLQKQTEAEAELQRQQAEAASEFQGPIPAPGGGVLKRNFAEEIKRTNETIQKEIKKTEMTVGQLTQMLSENEAQFKATASTMGLSAVTVQFLEQQLQKKNKATTDSSKATKELTKDTEEQRRKLEALGIVTRDSVNKQFGELNELWSAAVAEGVPLQTLIKLMGPAFQELADKAKKSNVEVKGLTETVNLLTRATPKLDSLTLIGGGTESLMKVGAVLKNITSASLEAQAQQIRTTESFEFFGIKTQRELQQTAQVARDQYRALTESGLASASQLKAARQTVLEAERAAAGETVSIWKTQILPNVLNVVDTLTAAVNGSFAQMLLGAKSWKDGLLDIVKSFAAAAVQAVNQVISGVTNSLLKGIKGALSGQSGAFGQAFGGMFGGLLGGGAAVPGLANSAINVGGGLSGGFSAAGGAGLSGAALAGLTAGIGGAIIAGFALYSRQNNVTAKSREQFAIEKGFKDLGALYTSLQGMGPRGQQLANEGLNVIGRKDTEAQAEWEKKVTAFMATVENFASTVTTATGSIAAGFTGKLSSIFDKQTRDQLKAFDEQIKAAQEAAAAKLEAEELSSDERRAIADDLAAHVKSLEDQKAQFVKNTNAEIVANTQVEFDRISRITLGAFNAARGQGQSQVQAIQTVGAAIDSLGESAERFGFAGNTAYEELLKWRELTTIAAPILEQTQGLTDLMKVLGDLGRLDQQMFSDLQAQGLAAYQSLIEAGFSEAKAREAVKPLIEEEIRLAKEKNLTIDKGTAELIKQMRANGELKEDTKSLVNVFIEGFGALLKFLKVDLPAGWATTAAAAEDAAERTQSRWSSIRFKIPVDFEAGEFPSAPGGFTVPGAAKGGIFMKPQIIGIGEAGPEAAIPLNRLHEFTGSSFDPVINLHNYMDGRKFTETVVLHLREVARVKGVRPI